MRYHYLSEFGIQDELSAEHRNNFENIAQLAKIISKTAFSAVTFFTNTKEIFISQSGFSINQIDINQSIFHTADKKPEHILVIEDLRKIKAFKDHILVNNSPGIVFYAGVPIHAKDGSVIGSLSVMDVKPGNINPDQEKALKLLTNQVIQLLELNINQIEIEEAKTNLSSESVRLRAIIDASRVGTWEWNVQTGEVIINDRWAEIIGYSKEELSPFTIDVQSKVIYPDDKPIIEKELNKCLNNEKEYYDVEYRMVHKDGHLVWVNDKGQILEWTKAGKPLVMFGGLTDITDKKGIENHLETTHQSLRERIKEQSCLYNITNLSTHDYDSGKLLTEVVKTLPQGWQYPEFTAVLISFGKKTFKSKNYKKTKWYQSTSRSTLQGEPLSIFIYYLNEFPNKDEGPFLNEERRLLESVADNLALMIDKKDTHKRHRLLLNSTEEGVYGIDEKGNCTFINPAAAKMLGYTLDECLGKNMHELIHHKKPDGSTFAEKECPIYQAKSSLSGCRIERDQFIRKNGASFDVRYSSAPVMDGDKIVGAVIVFNDISATLKSQEEMSLLISNTEESFILMDKKLNILTFNEQFRKLYFQYFGLEVKKGTSILNYAPPDRRQALKNIYQKVLKGEKQEAELKLPVKNEDERIFHINYKSARDSFNEIIGAFAVITDITEKKYIEEKLILSEKRFKAMVQDGSDLIAIVDLEGNYKYVSPNYKDYIGISDASQINKSAFEFVHPEDVNLLKKEFKKIRKENRVKSSPYRFRHKKHGWCWLQSIGTDMRDEKIIDGVVVNSSDITELIETQQKLKASEARYRGFYESQTNYVIRTDMDGQYTYVNKKFLQDFGWIYENEQAIGQHSSISFCDYEYEKINETVLKCIAEPENSFKIEIDKPSKDGGTVTTLWDFVCIVDATGNPSEIQCVGLDITDRIKMEGALRESNKRFELIMEASSESIYDLNPNTNELYLSNGFTRIFGIEPKTLKRNKDLINSHLHPHDKAEVLKSFNTAIYNSNDTSWSMKYRLKKSNGSYAFIHDKATVIRDHEQKAIRVLGVVRDISAEHVYAQLEQMEKEVIEMSMKPNAELKDVLEEYMLKLESIFPDMKASILKIVNNKLQNLASPSLPKGYTKDISGQSISKYGGSCGTAAFLKEKVIVENVFQDERWADYKHLAKKYHFAACWSQPIFNSMGNVIATFANYYTDPRKPGKLEEHAIERSQRLISIILTKFDHIDSIKKSNERFTYLNKATKDAVYDWDILQNHLTWGESFERLFGHRIDPERIFPLSDWEKLVHPLDIEETKSSLDSFLKDKKRIKWDCEYRFKKADETFSWVEEIGYLIRDDRGKPSRMIGALRDITTNKEIELQRDLQENVSKRFKERKNLNEGIKSTLKYLVKYGKFKTAEAWLISSDNKHINLVSTFTPNGKNKTFHERSSNIRKFKKGEGLPGIVWLNEKAGLWTDINRNKSFTRYFAAKESNLEVAYGIPLFDSGKPIGVMVFLSNNKEYRNDEILYSLRSLQNFIGSEIKRKQQEEEMLLIFQSAPDILAVTSPGGYFTKVNPSFCELLGFSEEELTSTPYESFVHPDDLIKSQEEFGITITGERQAKNFTNRLRTCNGDYRWISWNSSRVFGEDNHVFSYGRDITELKNLQKLLDNATKLARLGGWEVDLLNNKMYWSTITKEIHEVPHDFIPDLDTAINFYKKGNSRETITKKISEAIKKGISYDIELQIITAKRNERWVRAIGQAEFIKNKCVRLFGSFQDIHERKIAQLTLQSLLEEKNRILESIGDAFFTVDKEFTVTYWNRMAEKLLQTPRKKILGENLWEVFHDAVDLPSYKNYHKAMDTMEIIHFEDYYAPFKKWFGISAYPSEEGLTVYFKDITEQKIATEKIRQSNERFERISEATNDAIWDYNIVENKLFWGKGFATLFGFDLDHTTPGFDLMLSHIHPEDKDEIVEKINQYMNDETSKHWYAEYRFRRSDGTYAYIIDRASFIRNNKGKAIRALGAMTDITERKNYEASLQQLNSELEKSNSELEQFAYVASHDLQEPLRMVTGFLTQLEKKYSQKLDEKASQYIFFAVDGAKRMRQIILDLLEFSRVGRHNDQLEAINTEEIITDILRLQKNTIEENHASIYYKNLPTILSYRSSIIQIFHNLISNAIKYGKDNVPPQIEIKAVDLKNEWKFSVKDNGIGIEKEYFDKVFVIFQRLHGRDEYSGTGIGLSIVRKNVENLNGKIWIESEPKKGTTFHFTIKKLIPEQ